MFGFILFVSLLMFMAKEERESLDKNKEEPYKMELIDASKFAEHEKTMKDLYNENLPFYLFLIAVNMAILAVFFIGVFLDINLLYKWKKNNPFLKRTLEPASISWDFNDIIRFVIMFYAFGYAFMLLQAALSEKYPDFISRNLRFILNTTVIDIAGILFVLNFVVFIHKEKLASIGITFKNFARNIFYGISGYAAIVPLLFITMIITAIIITILKYEPPVQQIVDVLLKEQKVPVLVYSSIFAAIAGPIMEEIFFRGFMYNALKKHLGIFWGIAITATIFSLLHGHLVGFMPILILGILLTYLYEKTGSLIPSITVHITHNLASLLMVLITKSIYF